jgi:TctA family transporter
MVLGLVASIVLASGSLLHALGMIVLGLLLGLVGTDVNSGTARYSFGVPELADGISFVTVAMGVFGLGEIIANLAHEETRSVLMAKVKGLMPTRDDWGKIIAPILRGTSLGAVLGSFRAAARCWRRSRPTRSKRRCRRIRRTSAKARSKAWRRRRPPTTRVRKHRSFRC